MKKILLALSVVLVLAGAAFADNPNKDFDEGYVKLLDTHCIRTFVEGTPVGDEFIMGARGSIHFIYLSGNGMARTLMEKFWPGPLTLVLPAKEIVPYATRGGLETAAVRMPDNRIALELIRAADLPVSAPSANKSGRPSPTDAQTVRGDLGSAVAQVLDGGETKIGVESTVIDVTGSSPVLLRAGGLPKEKIEEALGLEVLLPQDKHVIKRSPGTRYRHYAPKLPLLPAKAENAEKTAQGRKYAWMGTSEISGSPVKKLIFKSEEEYAHEVFRALRKLEKSGAEIIIAEIPSEKGIGLAIKDRLNRAAGN